VATSDRCALASRPIVQIRVQRAARGWESSRASAEETRSLRSAAVSNPSETAVKTLSALSRNLGFYNVPNRAACEEHLTDPRWRQVHGQIAHIKGERPGSARDDPDQSESERQDFDNRILLCPNCHNMIDRLRPQDHTVDVLLEMKRRHLDAGAGTVWCDDEATLAELAQDAIRQYVERMGPEIAPATSGPTTPFVPRTTQASTREIIDENMRVRRSDIVPGIPPAREPGAALVARQRRPTVTEVH
jgi:hypothetical protein